MLCSILFGSGLWFSCLLGISVVFDLIVVVLEWLVVICSFCGLCGVVLFWVVGFGCFAGVFSVVLWSGMVDAVVFALL